MSDQVPPNAGPTLRGRRVLLIVSGGIAAYKALELVRLLTAAGCAVRCVLTEAGAQFVTPLSLQALSGHPVHTTLWSLTDESEMGHIALSRSADLLVVCPGSADLLARMAAGLASDLASTLLLATDTPVLVAPAMNVRMWLHPATQANLATLRARGIGFVGPDEGIMACNEFGPGRLAEPPTILRAIADTLDAGAPVPGPGTNGGADADPGRGDRLANAGTGNNSDPAPNRGETAGTGADRAAATTANAGPVVSSPTRDRTVPRPNADPAPPMAAGEAGSDVSGSDIGIGIDGGGVVLLPGAATPGPGSGGPARDLAGRHALVTAGPTHEPIDPVRFIANRSSGRQGYAIAAALAARGARVTLVSGPTALPAPPGVNRIDVETAVEMLAACQASLPADVAVLAAAVADWRAERPAATKLKKRPGETPPPLALALNPDILARLSGPGPARPRLVVGFAAETGDLLDHAAAKLDRKGCDWIVANDVSDGTGIMGGEHNEVHLLTRDGAEHWLRCSKRAVADRLADRIAAALEAGLPGRLASPADPASRLA